MGFPAQLFFTGKAMPKSMAKVHKSEARIHNLLSEVGILAGLLSFAGTDAICAAYAGSAAR